TWHCKEEYFHENSPLVTEALVLHFDPSCLGKGFLDLPEAYLIPRLFEKAKKGLAIYGESKVKLSTLLHKALESKNLDRIIYLISILKILSESHEVVTIAPAYAFQHRSNVNEMARL